MAHPFENAFQCQKAEVERDGPGFRFLAPCKCPASMRVIHKPESGTATIVEGCALNLLPWLCGETIQAAQGVAGEHAALRRDVQEGLGEIRNATAQGFAQVAAFFQASLPAGPPALPEPQD